ncbi:MAG: nucleotidyltransferase family protein [Armatimonadetes bacterium]|nr:nucleotidyltransferase family protein [Armatimonadota bacterium]
MKALILAAGYGTRMQALIGDCAKPLLPVGGQPVIDYLFDQLATIDGLEGVVVVTNALHQEQFAKWSACTCCEGVQLLSDGSRSNDERLGAIGDLQFAVEAAALDDDLLVAGGDNIFRFQIGLLVDFFHEKQADAIAVVREKRPERLGRSSTLRLNDEGRVIAFAEKASEPLSNLICPPLYLFRRETLPLVKRYLDGGYSPDAPGHFIEWLYRQTPVYGMLMPDGRYDIGSPESYREACQALGD